MRSEREKMLAGESYDPMAPDLVAGRERARDLCQALNATRQAEQDERRRIVRELFGGAIMLPGVRIGSRSVVTDVPADVVRGGGSLCRVVRELAE